MHVHRLENFLLWTKWAKETRLASVKAFVLLLTRLQVQTEETNGVKNSFRCVFLSRSSPLPGDPPPTPALVFLVSPLFVPY